MTFNVVEKLDCTFVPRRLLQTLQVRQHQLTRKDAALSSWASQPSLRRFAAVRAEARGRVKGGLPEGKDQLRHHSASLFVCLCETLNRLDLDVDEVRKIIIRRTKHQQKPFLCW